MKRALAVLIISLAGTALWAVEARSEDTTGLAKEHFQKGQVQYRLGHFDKALEEYSKSYEYKQLPEILFNIGQCHREMGNYEKAIYSYESFLRQAPASKNRPMAEDLLKESQNKLKEKQEAERRQKEEQARKQEEQKRKEEEQRLAALSRPILAPAPAPAPSSTASVEQQESPFYKTWWFWTIVGGVAAAAAGGTIYAVRAMGQGDLPPGTLGTLDRK